MVTIRPAAPADAPAILDAHVASIREFGPRTYDDRQVEAWATKDGPGQYPLEDDEQYVVVAERDDPDDSPDRDDESGGPDAGVAGFGALDLAGEEVWAVYVHPDCARDGVGSALLSHLETTARERGIGSLTLVSSLNAVPFYERHGWEAVEEVTVENTGGVELDCLVMRTDLDR